MKLNFADYIVFAGYMISIVFIGLWVAKKEKKTSSGYFLAGRSLPWFVIGFSMVASSVSVEQFLGEVGYAYKHGMAVANWEWGILPALTLMLVIFVPYYLRNEIRTMPEFLEKRFGLSSRVIFAVMGVIIFTFINLAGVLYASGVALRSIFGVNLYLGICILAAVAGIYTVAGGLASVAWTDVLQSILLLGSGLLVFFLGVKEVGSWQAICGTGDRARIMLDASHPDLPWTGMMVLFFSTNVWYYATNQYINQRVLGAKDEWHARAGILFTCFLGIPLTLAVCFPGFVAYALDPNLPNPDEAYPFVVNTLIGPLGFGIRGLVFAGLIGAIMSTVDSLANSTSTIVTIDFYKRFWNKNANERQMIRFGRISAAVIIITGVLWTPIVAKWGSIFTYFQECYTFMAVPTVVVFVSGMLWKRSNSSGATSTLLLCVPLLFLPLSLKHWKVQINTYNLAGLLFVPVVTFHVIMTYLKPAQSAEHVKRWTWNRSMLKLPRNEGEHYPWYKNLILWWIVALIAFVSIYIMFW